jgi:hypothetical protein
MSRRLIRLDVLKQDVAGANPLFTAKDVSEDEHVHRAHLELVDYRNYHTFVGGALSGRPVALGIANTAPEVARGPQRPGSNRSDIT